MKKLKMRVPSPAMLVALLALVVAMGGVSYAAIKIPKGSVGSKQLKKNAVTAKKIKKNAVVTAKVKNGAITAGKLAPGVVSKNAETLDGLAASSLVRTAVAFSNNPQNVSGQATILTTNITAPVAGYLVVNASTDVRSVTDDFADCSLTVDDTSMNGGNRTLALKVGTAHPETVCPTNATMPVQAGAHKVDFKGMGADADVKWGRSSLQATFIPFGPTGAQP